MNIENNIRTKALAVYMVAAIGLAIIALKFYDLKNKINNERSRIEFQQHSLKSVNRLISEVNSAQSLANKYISTKNPQHIAQFDSATQSINQLILQIHFSRKEEKTQLEQISQLLTRQSANLLALNRYFEQENPVTKLNQRLNTYQPPHPTESQQAATLQDTTIHVRKKKPFFNRLKNVFSPSTDSMLVIHQEKIIRLKTTEQPAILSEVKEIAQQAGSSYDDNLKSISQQVTRLMTADKEISGQLSSLLFHLQDQSLRSMLEQIAQTETSLNRNYLTAGIAGGVAMLLILIFVLLIIYDVNKGREAREKLRQVMESRHRLLLSVSHDIKSPLTSINGYLELQSNSREKQAMQNSVSHISALLENLLEFSALEQGTLTNTRGCFDLRALLAETEQMFQPLVERTKLALHTSASSVRIVSDRIKLKQIIINLLSNAVKYTRQGEITLSLLYEADTLCISVSDTGVGIPADKMADLFKPFSRVERNNAMAHGSGLGMYVVKGLVDALGGSITLNSTPDEGTTVEIRIPAQQISSSLPSGTKRIVVFDDDPVVLGIVRDLLLQLGHQLVETDYDVILTDMEMEEISGTDVLSSSQSIPVVLMTGRSDFTYENALQLGFADYIAKPFSIDSLRMVFGEGDTPPLANEFMGEDEDEIREIFRQSTTDNFAELNEALLADDYFRARQLCHKMLTMFVLLGYPAEELRRMDIHRDGVYEGWQQDVEKILTIKV